MSKYLIEFTPAATRQFKKLQKSVQVRIASVLDKLASNPFISGYKKLVGHENLYRIRVGDYRIVYQFVTGKIVIVIVRIGHRKDIYSVL